MNVALESRTQQYGKASSGRWARVLLSVAALAAITAAAFIVLRERRKDIDINSGRLRSQVTVGPIVISETIRNTPFSELVAGRNDSHSPEWRRVNTEGILGTHGRYGLAASALKRFVIVCENAHVDHDRQVLLGRRLLELLRDEHFDEAEKLIDELSDGQRPYLR